MKAGGEAAFPQTYPDDPTKPVWADNALSRGLTKREWSAGMALQGILASGQTYMRAPSHAVGYADELLAELAK